MKKVIKGALALAGVAAVAYEATIQILFRMVAVVNPKSILFKTPVPDDTVFGEGFVAGREWLQTHPQEEVTIESFDGLTLKGHYFEAANPKRTVIMCHGWRGFWYQDFAVSAKWFYEQGCNLLMIEQRGNVEGAYMGMGVLERKDCRAWIQFLEDTGRTELPVYLCGVSMGAATVLMTTGEELPPYVKGVIADCGFTSPYDMVLDYGRKKYKIKEHPLMDLLDRKMKRTAGYSLKEYSTLDAMKECKIPILFIHGTADDFVPCEMTLENFEACKAPKDLLLVENAGHCMSFVVDPKAYQEKVLEFFKKQESAT